MLRMIGRNAGGRIYVWIRDLPKLLRFLNSRLYRSHTGQILVQLIFVVRVELVLHAARVIQHKIEDGLLIRLPTPGNRRAFAMFSCPKKSLEYQARIGLGRYWSGW